MITGEGSPYYLFHPAGPARVAAAVPAARLIAMLRDPVERAYSHYQQEYARGFEDADTFERALELEPGRLAGERERMLADPAYASRAMQHHAYVARGEYVDQLTAWRERFPAERTLVISYERFFADPETGYAEVLRFLGLPDAASPPRFKAYNAVPPRAWRRRRGRGCGHTSPSPTGGWRSTWAPRWGGRAERSSGRSGDDRRAACGGRARAHEGPAHGRARRLAQLRRRRSRTACSSSLSSSSSTRSLTKHASGAFFEAIALFLILSNTAELGADTGLTRMIPRYRVEGRVADVRRSLSVGLVPSFAGGVVLAAISYALASPLAELFTNHRHADAGAVADLHPRACRVRAAVVGAYTVAIAATRGFGTMVPNALVDRIGKAAVQTLAVAVAVLAGGGSFAVAVAWGLPIGIAFAVALVWLGRLVHRVERRERPTKPATRAAAAGARVLGVHGAARA